MVQANGTAKIVMVVDDSIENLTLLETALSRAGYDVRLAPNGKLALRALQSFRPDVMLLDINMPGMDGIEVCRKVRDDTNFDGLPIIFMSGYTDEEQDKKIAEAGGTAVILKPYRVAALIALVERYVNGS